MFGLKIVAKIVAPELKVKFDEDDFTCFDFEEEAIIIGKDFDAYDFGFMRHLRQKHKMTDADKFSIRLWTILHEIGHYETEDECESDEFLVRAALGTMDREDVVSSPMLQDCYFNLESEWKATEWAIEWVRSHRALAAVFNVLVRI